MRNARDHYLARVDPVQQPSDQQPDRARGQRRSRIAGGQAGAAPAEIFQHRRKKDRAGIGAAAPHEKPRDEQHADDEPCPRSFLSVYRDPMHPLLIEGRVYCIGSMVWNRIFGVVVFDRPGGRTPKVTVSIGRPR